MLSGFCWVARVEKELVNKDEGSVYWCRRLKKSGQKSEGLGVSGFTGRAGGGAQLILLLAEWPPPPPFHKPIESQRANNC